MLFVVIVVLVLHIVANGATATTIGTSSSSIPVVEILASSSPSATLYSCFFADDNEVDLRSEKEACCKNVVERWRKDDNNNNNADYENNGPSIVMHQRCLLEMAQVPSSISATTTPSGNPDDTAKFSWVVSKTSESAAVKPTSMEQYLWTPGFDGSNESQLQPIRTISPYHKTTMQSLSMSNNSSQSIPLVAAKLDSHLGQDGGMHRLFHHTFQPAASKIDGGNKYPIYYLYLTVPQGMFIDLDDPFEPAATGMIQSTPTTRTDNDADTDSDNSDTSHNFVVTASAQSNAKTSLVMSFRARLHAATICDIEQPSFVSGQHLLVWEIDNIVTTTTGTTIPPVIEFATKLHLRYPHPSLTLEEWIDLPRPLLFVALPSESSVMLKEILQQQQQYDWDLGVVERVWVAAGKDEDHDWIMGMTISFCLIGVAIMLRDVSRVSLWDDV